MVDGRVSVLIPSRGERFLQPTINSFLDNMRSDVEVIVVLDGYWPDPPLQDRQNLVVIHRSTTLGMRASINAAAAVASGEYLLKSDGHCLFAEGYDVALKADCDDNWIVIPRRYSLDAENWKTKEKTPIDYHYLSCPLWAKREHGDYSMHGIPWNERSRERRNLHEYDIDETPSFQGSSWFMHRKHWDWLGGMHEEGYGTFSQEPQEIGNKTWLGGGKVVVNKKTWYAHLHKGKQYGRGYFISSREVAGGHEYSAHYWMNNQWLSRIHDIEWLVDRFKPMPTWDIDWKELHEHERRTTQAV